MSSESLLIDIKIFALILLFSDTPATSLGSS